MSRKQAVVFGPSLATLRRGQGINQKTLARRAGISEGLLANLEAGYRHPSRETLVSLAKAGGWPVEAIGAFLNGQADTLRDLLPELVAFTRSELAGAAA